MPGGTYQSYAVNLRSRLPAFRTTTRSTKGSAENLELLAAGRADIGFAQLDVYAGLMQSDPERFRKIEIIGRLSMECVYIAYRKGGRVTSILDLQKAAAQKHIPFSSEGSSLTRVELLKSYATQQLMISWQSFEKYSTLI